MNRYTVFLVLFLIFTACEKPDGDETEQAVIEEISVHTGGIQNPERLSLVESTKITNVILLIGDGTGLAQITSGQLNLVGKDGMLHIQTMPVTGIVKTHSSDNLITDSAAGATAYSCGIKTYNGAIAVTPDKKRCKTILEMAEEKGLATGLVATSSITHATPASFGAHVESRSMENEIAAQLLASGSEILLGGGMEFFASDYREDSRDLLGEFSEAGYQILSTAAELEAAEGNKLLGLFAEDGLERNNSEPLLPQMAEIAIDRLSKDEDGFFLMIEGSQIDWGGHGNDANYVLEEVRDFDQTVKAVLDFAQKDGETLVVLTADHETGGMTLTNQKEEGKAMEIYWPTDYHTATPVPLMAYGPRALEFMGWRDNTYIGVKLAELLDVGTLPSIEE
ncbi:MAG: alkaline phosphatase [Balneolaceae bacterium]|nr:alkaline phosphatase [Balneolaceae bacterium]